MVTAIGLDLVEIERIARDIDRFGPRFVNRILSPAERRLGRDRLDQAQFLAGRFAAKEAAVKALGRYLDRRPPWSALEILPDTSGQPHLHLPDPWRSHLGNVGCLLSITHEKKYAAAVAVLVER